MILGPLFKRRILIGAVIGIFVASMLSWINGGIWRFLESQVIDGHALLNPISPFSSLKKDLILLNFDKKTNDYLKGTGLLDTEDQNLDLNTEAGQELVFEMIKNLNFAGASAIGVIVDFDVNAIQDLEIEANIDGLITPLVFAHDDNTQHQRARNGRTYKIEPNTGFAYELFRRVSTNDGPKADKEGMAWLNTSRLALTQYSVVDFIENKVPADELAGKIVVIGSSQNQRKLQTELTILSNYLSSNWLNYFKIPAFFALLALMAIGVLLVLAKSWVKAITAAAVLSAYFVFGQLVFSFLGVHIETAPFIVAMVLIFLLASLVDYSLVTFSLKEKLRFVADNQPSTRPGSSAEMATEIDNKMVLPGNNISDKILSGLNIVSTGSQEEQKRSFADQEERYETIALTIQEKTVQSLMDLQGKVDEILLNDSHSSSGKSDLHLLNYDINKTMDDLDNILFDLVPFHLEKDRGVIDPIQHLADKVLYKSGGAMRATFTSDIDHVELDKDLKISFYRILQNIIDLIIVKSRGTNAHIDLSINNNWLKTIITYDGLNVNPGKGAKPASFKDHRFNDIYKRADLMDIDVQFMNDMKTSTELTNKVRVEFALYKGLIPKAVDNENDQESSSSLSV